MRIRVLILAGAILICLAPGVLSEDVRYRPPGHWMIPGILEGEFSGVVVVNVLPDVITSTVELLTPTNAVQSLVPERTVEKK